MTALTFRPDRRVYLSGGTHDRQVPGTTGGFADFVTARSAALLRSAWLLTGDAGRAEDLLQTVLAGAWRRWSTVVAAGHPEAYLRRALFTTYVSWWRRVAGRVPGRHATGGHRTR